MFSLLDHVHVHARLLDPAKKGFGFSRHLSNKRPKRNRSRRHGLFSPRGGSGSSSTSSSDATGVTGCSSIESICANQGVFADRVIACYDMVSADSCPVLMPSASSTRSSTGSTSSSDDDRRLQIIPAPELLPTPPGSFDASGSGSYNFKCTCLREASPSGSGTHFPRCIEGDPENHGGLIIPATTFPNSESYSFYMGVSQLNFFREPDSSWYIKAIGFDDVNDEGVYLKHPKGAPTPCKKELQFWGLEDADKGIGHIDYTHPPGTFPDCSSKDDNGDYIGNNTLIEYSFHLLLTRNASGIVTSYFKRNLTDSWNAVFTFNDTLRYAVPEKACNRTGEPCFGLFKDDEDTNYDECTPDGGQIDFLVLYDGAVDPARM